MVTIPHKAVRCNICSVDWQ